MIGILPIKFRANLCHRSRNIKDYKYLEIRGMYDILAPPVGRLVPKLNQHTGCPKKMYTHFK